MGVNVELLDFYNSLAISIKAKKRTRAEYEVMIASWTEAGLLTPDEAMALMTLLCVKREHP